MANTYSRHRKTYQFSFWPPQNHSKQHLSLLHSVPRNHSAATYSAWSWTLILAHQHQSTRSLCGMESWRRSTISLRQTQKADRLLSRCSLLQLYWLQSLYFWERYVFVVGTPKRYMLILWQWTYLGANLSHLGKATAAAPISHTLFFGSIISLEGIFFLYYYSWNLFQTLPVAGIFGLVAFLSGSKALSEVQSRRLAGER